MTRITRRRALAAGASTLLLPQVLRAEGTWPSGPVTLIVGYAAGGGADINARELAQIMSPLVGQQMIVDNKGGAAGSLGVRVVASAKPDGQTLFYAVGTNVIINPHIQKGMLDTMAAL
ncbi:MAG: tripartite tricarboxylate transporter substrate binding protein, partial [Proteobacteria bacterium]|nr:tripartite tricarboxylate transporter substrate binding protein [Pseudomonadota bacterium]